MPAEGVQGSIGLERRVVKNESVPQPRTEALAVDRKIVHAGLDHVPAGGVAVSNAALAKYVTENIDRPHRGRGGGDVHQGVVNVIAPDPHVHVGPFALDAVIPAVGDDIAVDVRVAVGAALKAEVVGTANSVVKAMILGGLECVVPNNVASASVDH